MDLPIPDQLEYLEQEHADLKDRYEKLLAEVARLSQQNDELSSKLATIEGLWETVQNHGEQAREHDIKRDSAWVKLRDFIRSGQ